MALFPIRFTLSLLLATQVDHSGDPSTVVADVPITTDVEGHFCFVPYTVQADDWGEYTVDLWLNGEKTGKNDNYRVKGLVETVLQVVKTANPTYTKTYSWTIDKVVDTASHSLKLGEFAVSNYTVTINRVLVENWSVTGSITITNPSKKNPVQITAVTDTFNGVPASVSCPATSIDNKQSMTCTYSISGTGTPTNGNNVATVTAQEDGPVQGASSAPVAVIFSPQIVGYESVSVTDSWKGPLTFVNGVATYPRTFTCGTGPEAIGTTNYPNTATIDQTQQSDSANVAVTCSAHAPLEVSKTANTSYDRKYDWTITKVANPTAHSLMDGQTGTSNYTVSLDQTVTDINISVSGIITIHNPATIAATISGVTDNMGPTNCGVSFPYELSAGGTLSCSYVANPATIANSTNTATVSTIGLVGGGSGSTAVVFGQPTHVIGYPTITVTDTNQAGSQSFSADGTWQYSATFPCDLVGSQSNTSTEYPNTATISETQQSASAMVTVGCSAYAPLTISKTAVTSFIRTHSWTIDKSVDVAVHNLLVGQSAPSTYKVDLVKTTVDSGFKVDGDITITNNAAIAANVTGVSDSLVGAVVTCPVTLPYSLAVGGSLTCTYTAPLPDANPTVNTAAVTTSGLVLGNISAPVAVTFGAPTVVGKDTVTVTDLMADGVFGPFNTSTSFTYPHTFTCPDPINLTINNTATIVETGAFDTASVALNCAVVPTLTPTPTPTFTPTSPIVTPTDDPGTSTPVPTLPPPTTNTTTVLIPVTGADLSMPAPLANLQTVFGKLGLMLLGLGLVLQGLSKKYEE